MFGRKIILTGIVGMVLLVCSGKALGGAFSIRLSTGHKKAIAEPIGPVFNHGRFHKGNILMPHHRRTFLKRRPRLHKLVVVKSPFRRQIAVNLVPAVTVVSRRVQVEPATVTVWITNSNGSQTSVSLRKSGPGFVGPRGEWYPQIPANEQLRVVYGF
jgi:hypothetical protein